MFYCFNLVLIFNDIENDIMIDIIVICFIVVGL